VSYDHHPRDITEMLKFLTEVALEAS